LGINLKYVRTSGVPHIIGNLSMRATTLLQTYLNRKSSQDVMALQNAKSPNFEIFITPSLGVPGQNDIWMQPLWLITENIIKEKVVASPKFELWWILWVCVCMWLICAPKIPSNHALINLLFGLCRSVWIIDPLIIRPNPHLGTPTHPFTPKMLQAKESTPIPFSVVFTFKVTFESFKECGGVSM